MKKLLTFFATLLLSLSVVAWPTRPITLIVPSPPGGLIDKFARVIQKDFQDKVTQPVEIMYLPGAANAVAVAHVQGRPNDNHTFIISDAGFVVGPALVGTKTYRDFVPVALIGESPYVMFTANKDNRFRQQIRNRDMINVGVANQAEIWLNDLKSPMPLNPIPYKGAAPMMLDVIPGHTEYGILAYTGMVTTSTDGQVTPVLVFGDRRLAALPNIPTATEMGFSGTYTTNWYPIYAKQDTDPKAVTAMSRLVQQTVGSKFRDFPGLTILNYGPQKTGEYASREIRIFERIAEKTKQ
jgi:tripartite-type tricarboxylate transporter receptor subunit TctC